MKKLTSLLILFLSTLTFISCSSDDSSSVDELIGAWKLVQWFVNGVDQELVCDDTLQVVFSSNGNYKSTYYDDDTGSCELDLNDTEEGIWTNNGGNSYTFTDDEFSSTIEIVFINDKFTSTSETNDGSIKVTYQRQ